MRSVYGGFGPSSNLRDRAAEQLVFRSFERFVAEIADERDDHAREQHVAAHYDAATPYRRFFSDAIRVRNECGPNARKSSTSSP